MKESLSFWEQSRECKNFENNYVSDLDGTGSRSQFYISTIKSHIELEANTEARPDVNALLFYKKTNHSFRDGRLAF